MNTQGILGRACGHKTPSAIIIMDAETLAQLQSFANQEGRKWKSVLSYEYWMRGLPVPGFPLLYGLRNHPSFGPTWLHNFRLPK